MNTKLKNVDFDPEIRLFMAAKPPTSPLPILYALVDSFLNNGPEWMQSDEAKAMLHSLNRMIHGPSYQINGPKEHSRLVKVFGQ
jgi:hypothetical protein